MQETNVIQLFYAWQEHLRPQPPCANRDRF
ncbi:conserved hypothetical protein [Thiomonas arsenitoxydans]|uniref:Uncharacterized protein n=1 Tax=Thiomonas arsenitoxydans (strain DSM 22701 / CIP 110005 / 3As) TaxID=426114 RepID=D6CQ75_THIA3|nr:hypothetical protein THI_1473 [Thiomonas arsenitoxydans]CQR32528.1 conserved hypothetical protein [Thiomonas arsenitoxydans]CQR32876.1 conserved hypothetical protein [Thiomonas arsenitoxydans]CQR34134.1 conserved hypothetical protein [Thiomonas arsenitoxydans]CQR40418.1 conserved hypothetical protein [Thiomonas arsenitoxydans]